MSTRCLLMTKSLTTTLSTRSLSDNRANQRCCRWCSTQARLLVSLNLVHIYMSESSAKKGFSSVSYENTVVLYYKNMFKLQNGSYKLDLSTARNFKLASSERLLTKSMFNSLTQIRHTHGAVKNSKQATPSQSLARTHS